ncbi:flagellar basal body-associated protein FliL [Paraburkholderia phosphatilytica]|uniref:flagellar basal body-associated protein FliL n=1 Tax=Paraburkholderia phosphatilytica TaxID=2282883 RepID=UPI000E490160|nr:flagellar basal body-associated protein FliL [Paraburkholderia phosphatilytica]
MASTTANQQPAAQPARPGFMKRLIIILVIVLIAAGGAGAGVWFFMKKQAPAGAAQAAAPKPAPAPVFFPLDSMTVNLLSDDGQQHYLRVGLTLKLDDQKAQERINEHMPEIRSRILLALSNKHPDDLATLDGKHALAKELVQLIEQPTDKGEEPLHVEDVLFTEFVVQ